MKKFVMMAAILLASATAFAQKQAGSIVIGGQFNISTHRVKTDFGNTERTKGKTLDFSIMPSIHYFLTDEIAIGGYLGYQHQKELIDIDDDLYQKTGMFSIRPSLIYNWQICEKFSYMPEFFIGLGFPRTKVEIDENTTVKYKGFAYSIGLELLKFEFNPCKNIGLMFSCGELSYTGSKMDINDDDKIKEGSFKLNLNIVPTIGFRYYL